MAFYPIILTFEGKSDTIGARNMLERLFENEPKRVSRRLDLADKVLAQKYGEVSAEEINLFGADLLKNQMGTPPTSLKAARRDAKEKGKVFSKEIFGVLNGTESSENFKNRLKGTLSYGALAVTREVLFNPDLSYREKKRQLTWIETFLKKTGVDLQPTVFLVDEAKKEAKRREIVKSATLMGQMVLGAVTGVFGAEMAEKYIAFLPAAQELLGMGIIGGLAARRTVKMGIAYAEYKGFENKFSKKPVWKILKSIDRGIGKLEPFLLAFGTGMFVHGYSNAGVISKEVEGSTGKTQLEKHQAVLQPVQVKPEVPTVHTTVPTQAVETVKTVNYVVTGAEKGGLTDILTSFHEDPYGADMTKFILQNKQILTDQTRIGHESAQKLIEFLQAHTAFTWREAMNESAREGRATDISKLFTDALRFIRPGTVFAL